MTYSTNEKASGFTLIELLVVIAIIALLVSILLPSLQKAKEIAKQVSCLAQLKQVGSAMYIYSEEEEYFPPCYVATGQEGTTYENTFWQQKLLPYSGSPKALVCTNNPGTKSDLNYYYWFGTGHTPGTPVKARYALNHRAIGCGGYAKSGYACVAGDGSIKVEVNAGHLINPSKLVMCYDNSVTFGTPPSTYGGSYDYWNTYYFPEDLQHLGKVNVLFSDAHAESIEVEDDMFFEETEHWRNE